MTKPVDKFDRRPVTSDGPKHKRLDGSFSGDYFCMNCGAPITSTDLTHGAGRCEYNPTLVDELRKINLW